VDASIQYQSIIGFGGAFTDAAGINIAKLSRPAQDLLLRYKYYNTFEYNFEQISFKINVLDRITRLMDLSTE